MKQANDADPITIKVVLASRTARECDAFERGLHISHAPAHYFNVRSEWQDPPALDVLSKQYAYGNKMPSCESKFHMSNGHPARLTFGYSDSKDPWADGSDEGAPSVRRRRGGFGHDLASVCT